MPSRNIIREFAPDSYYHIYNRGVEKRLTFLDKQDYIVFLGLLKKYLTGEQPSKTDRHPVKSFADNLDLLAYCLMPNHFHLLLYQKQDRAISDFTKRLTTGYVMYFNNKYNRVGGLFQGPYKASIINSDAYLHHISRYIHLNPKEYAKWPYSSLDYYMGKKKATWLDTTPILELFNNDRKAYKEFIDDYNDTKQELSVLKWQLANDLEKGEA